eukprot:CAMPEP_0196732674 /NCGR_PEP_ID=MMETSP1091-20130531/12013_1 /TAXON_ID=302021 /ORGANISM="Rhodomonas sp., Strain CCMP768" /LENGTH=253 /DNA_ID=CAMNT_0042075979 /DNA_START=3 /DNA_END=760 /DNA_ORIENTATION=-
MRAQAASLASSALLILFPTVRAFSLSATPFATASSSAAARAQSCTKPWAMASESNIRVFLVRHGAVDLNSPGRVYPKGSFYGGDDVPLSALGELEAQAAGEMLKDEGIELVFCSPLRRAVYGAKQVAYHHGVEPIEDDRFREIERGRWLGLTKPMVDEKFPGDLQSFAQDPTWKEHGGETYTELFNRVLDGFDELLRVAREKKASKVALVSHMWVTKSVVTNSMGIKPTQQDEWEKVNIPTASISVMDFPREG